MPAGGEMGLLRLFLIEWSTRYRGAVEGSSVAGVAPPPSRFPFRSIPTLLGAGPPARCLLRVVATSRPRRGIQASTRSAESLRVRLSPRELIARRVNRQATRRRPGMDWAAVAVRPVARRELKVSK